MYRPSEMMRIMFLTVSLFLLSSALTFGIIFYMTSQPSVHELKKTLHNGLNVLHTEGIIIHNGQKKRLSDSIKFELYKSYGINIMPKEQAIKSGLSKASLNQHLSAIISDEFSIKTEVRQDLWALDPVLWINSNITGDNWINIHVDTIRKGNGIVIFLLISLIMLLLFIIAFIYLSLQLRPLRQLEKAALLLKNKELPELLKEKGGAEVNNVISTFNSIINDAKNLDDDRNFLMAAVSHDLRSPLTRIKLAASMINGAEPSKIDSINRSVASCENIINQFLDYIRADNIMSMSQKNLDATIIDILNDYKDLSKGITFRPSNTTLFIKMNDVAIKGMVYNMLSNAHKYGHGEIIISIGSDSNYAYIRVEDNGKGIAPEELCELLKPFKRGNEARTTEGSGLGLAIINRMIKSHQGRMELTHSKQLGGLAITLYFPLVNIG